MIGRQQFVRAGRAAAGRRGSHRRVREEQRAVGRKERDGVFEMSTTDSSVARWPASSRAIGGEPRGDRLERIAQIGELACRAAGRR